MLILASAQGVAAITAGATVLAGLIVAAITARTTNHRQERQLSAEANRQAAALVHARELADIADLRQVLDEAGGYLDGAKIIASRVQVMELTTANLTDTEDELPPIIASLLRALTRLRIRLGREDGQLADGRACLEMDRP